MVQMEIVSETEFASLNDSIRRRRLERALLGRVASGGSGNVRAPLVNGRAALPFKTKRDENKAVQCLSQRGLFFRRHEKQHESFRTRTEQFAAERAIFPCGLINL